MGLHDIAFLPSRATFLYHMSQNCDRGQTRACTLQNIFAPTMPLFVPVENHGHYNTGIKLR